MERKFHLNSPLNAEAARSLSAGQEVLISGPAFTARDAAHLRIARLLEQGANPPFDLNGALIIYAGASPAPPGRIIGSIGPTTSSRMDAFTPALLEAGLAGMIGKGPRSQAVNQAIARHQAVYFGAVGGLGALLSLRIKNAELVAFEELGPEAVYRLELDGFPVRVLTDSRGNDFLSSLGILDRMAQIP